MGYRNFLCRVLASSHDDLSCSYGFNDVKLRDHANSGVNLWRISGDHRRHRAAEGLVEGVDVRDEVLLLDVHPRDHGLLAIGIATIPNQSSRDMINFRQI